VLRARTPDFGGAWVQLFSEAAARKGSEVFWPVSVDEAGRQLICVVCQGGDQPWPQVRLAADADPMQHPVQQGRGAAAVGFVAVGCVSPLPHGPLPV